MTSLKIIEEQIYRFLESDTPEVIAIRGAWGTGKTYAWKKCLFTHKDKTKLEKYAYISLFGIDSLDALKFACFSNCIKKEEIKDENNNSTNGPPAVKFKKLLAHLKGFKGMNIHGVSVGGDFVAKALSYFSVERTIICLDDFERMRLDAQDVLGLISELKEQKSCKIILILNDEELSDEAKDQYSKYREKVIDKEFDFSPTAEECAEIVYGAEKHADLLKEQCCKLGVTNIRIIKKIQQLKDQLVPFLEGYEQETKRNALSSLVLFTYALYTKKEDFPDLDFIKNMTAYDFTLTGMRIQDDENDEETTKKSLWKDVLQDYGYRYSDELDLEIALCVERGYFINADIKREIEKCDEQVKLNKQDKSHSEAWGLYHNSFDDNAEELKEKMYSATKNHIAHISQSNLSSSLWLLRELGANDEADELIELAISFRDDSEYFDIENYTFRDRVNDQRMIERFQEVYAQRRTVKTPLEVLKDISSSNGWSALDEEVLASLSVDDYYQIFTSERGEHLDSYIRRCLQFGRPQDSTERQQLIADNAADALRRIGTKSELNNLRVRKFGIEVQEE